jgi:hypothetical protein
MQIFGPSSSFTNRRVPGVSFGSFIVGYRCLHRPSHQWVFVTDTVDAVYRPDNWSPEAMMDRLAEVATGAPVSETKVGWNDPVNQLPDNTTHGFRPIRCLLKYSQFPLSLIPRIRREGRCWMPCGTLRASEISLHSSLVSASRATRASTRAMGWLIGRPSRGV